MRVWVIYHHVQSCSVRASSEGKYTPPLSTLPLYVLCGADTLPLFFPYSTPICTLWGRYPPTIFPTLPLYVLCVADTLPLFLLYPYMYSVGQIHSPYFYSSPICTLWGQKHSPYFYSTPICTLWGRYTPPISILALYALCWADTLLLFLLCPYMYNVGQIHSSYFYSIPIYVQCGADTLLHFYTTHISTLPLYVLYGADTLPLFLLYPYMYSVAETDLVRYVKTVQCTVANIRPTTRRTVHNKKGVRELLPG